MKCVRRLPLLLCGLLFAPTLVLGAEPQPNILFCIADDWSWPHAGAYGDRVVSTPTFDRIAREGILFRQAFVSAPSCTSSRAAILTGQWHWRLKESANLWSTLRTEFEVYPDILETGGYHVGYQGKGWGPGKVEVGGRKTNPAGPRFKDFDEFLSKRAEGQPFCFWFGSSDPHRPYERGAGKESGIDPEQINVPGCLLDTEEVRNDLADYYFEVQRFDREVGEMLALLKEKEELDNTLIVMTSDNGMPFPRCKANLYDLGTRVPLAIRWPGKVLAGRSSVDLVSLTDLAPTFLLAAGALVPSQMTGRNLMQILTSRASGRCDLQREYVLTGKERHCPGQETPDLGGYPSRALRTMQFLYIRNYTPQRWPSGTPNYEKAAFTNAWYADCDNGPTKTVMVDGENGGARADRLFRLSFAKRPSEELYDLRLDPDQLNNLADAKTHEGLLERLRGQLTAALKVSKDPRETGGADKLEAYPYYGGAPTFPSPAKANAEH